MVKAEDFSHLTESAKLAVHLPNEQRIQKIISERWVGYTRAVQIINKLEELYSHPIKIRMPNLLIIGPTNNGKTMIIEKFRRTLEKKILESEAQQSQDAEHIPIIFIQMPPEPNVTRFYSLLLEAVNASIARFQRLAYLEQMVLNIFKKVKLKILIIDELHNLLAGSTQKQHIFLNLLRFLGNELRISLVGVGTKDAYLAIRSDDQLENRFEPLLLPHWEYGEEYLRLLASYVKALPLKMYSDITQPPIAEFIYEKTEGTIGEMVTLLKNAAQRAIETGEECINLKILSKVNYLSPSERRKLYKLELSR
jgi:Cdc6-like AAA superfamily ATPase